MPAWLSKPNLPGVCACAGRASVTPAHFVMVYGVHGFAVDE